MGHRRLASNVAVAWDHGGDVGQSEGSSMADNADDRAAAAAVDPYRWVRSMVVFLPGVFKGQSGMDSSSHGYVHWDRY